MEKWTVTAVNGNIKAKSGNNHPLFIYPLGHTWVRGLFVFSIAVHSQAARGQTLCSCVLN